MNSLILCEGKTDCVLLQYYLEKAYMWKRHEKGRFHAVSDGWSNLLEKKSNKLYIAETKGCSRIVEGLQCAISRNENSAPGSDEFFDRILIFTDNDEEITSNDVLGKVKEALKETSCCFSEELRVKEWNSGTINTTEGNKKFELYFMFIPFDECGALETYLLNCVGEHDKYDKTIIDKGNVFVENVDLLKKYLKHRRLITKAKFDVYFSVRTSMEQYGERQDILRSVEWEKYDTLRNDFVVFKAFG